MSGVNVSSSGEATITFADGVSYSFPTTLKAAEVNSASKWHQYDVGPLSLPTLQQMNLSGPMVLVPILYAKYVFEVQDAWMALKDYPALEYTDFDGEEFGNPVTSGSRTKVDLFGYVTHRVDDGKRVLINQTLPGHWLHEGYVARHVWAEGREVKIQTIGFGTGPYAEANTAGSFPVWGVISIRTIRNMAIRYYELRTGQRGTVYSRDPLYEVVPSVPEPARP